MAKDWTFPDVSAGDEVLHYTNTDTAQQNDTPRFAKVVKVREDGAGNLAGKSLDLLVFFNTHVRMVYSVRHADDPRHEQFPRWQEEEGVFVEMPATRRRKELEQRVTELEEMVRELGATNGRRRKQQKRPDSKRSGAPDGILAQAD